MEGQGGEGGCKFFLHLGLQLPKMDSRESGPPKGFSRLLSSLALKFLALKQTTTEETASKGKGSLTFGKWAGQQGWLALKDLAPHTYPFLCLAWGRGATWVS